jgi:CRISPR-associated endonuclease/helicase Cas3
MLAKKIARDAKVKAGDFEKIAKKVYDSHREQNALKKRNRTLIIVNTVKRAIELHRALKELLLKKKSWIDPVLIHSRFRPPDRKNVIEKLLSEPDEDGTIIVATQVVEAGVDVSARTLFTELAPWPSLVQRFGRCNRRGADDDAIIYWLDVKSTDSAPYDEKDMKLARERLKDIEGKNAGPMALKEYVEALDPKTRERLFQYEHIYVLRQHDLHGLFSTEPDMAGGYTDVSMFVRNIERESDVYVYWRDFKGFPSTEYPPPSRDELCSVRFFALKTLLGQKGFAWQWNSETGKWEQKRANDIRPGMTLLLSTSQGGYHKDHGWTGKASDKPSSVFDSVSNETLVETRPQESMSDEMPSETEWLFVSDHLRDTEAEARELVSKIQFDDDLWKRCAPSVVKGAWWHDVGKTLNRWQEAGKKQIAEIVAKAEKFLSENPGGDEVDFVREFLFKAKKQFADSDLWAKFPGLDQELKRSKLSAEARKRVKKAIGVQFRPGLRHEAASALAAWQEWRAKVDGWNALAVYLVACHHGKVRTVLRGTQSGEDIFGIEPEDALPQLAGWLSSERLLDLRPKAFGATGEWDESKNVYLVEMPSWIQMAAELLGPELPDDPDPCDAISDESEPRKLGPFRLAFLEALIRAADVKASRKPGKGGRNE